MDVSLSDPIQISLVYNDSRVGTNTNSNERFPVISNPAYEDTHPLQANTPIYENVQAINYPTL